MTCCFYTGPQGLPSLNSVFVPKSQKDTLTVSSCLSPCSLGSAQASHLSGHYTQGANSVSPSRSCLYHFGVSLDWESLLGAGCLCHLFCRALVFLWMTADERLPLQLEQGRTHFCLITRMSSGAGGVFRGPGTQQPLNERVCFVYLCTPASGGCTAHGQVTAQSTLLGGTRA